MPNRLITIEKNKDKTPFILHDGPPYLSSDKIHVGTALNKILKDIILKYKAQMSLYIFLYLPNYLFKSLMSSKL